MKCKENFITEITDLCETCFIHDKIENVRKNMIRKFEVIENNNTIEFIIKHLEGKINTSNEKIENIINVENVESDIYRENRNAIFLSWKDCLNYYSMKLIDVKKNQNSIIKSKPFNELYASGIIAGQIENNSNKGKNDNNERFYEFQFNDWLSTHKSWNKNNLVHYYELLNEENFFEFLRHYNIELVDNLVKVIIENMRKNMKDKTQLETDIKELEIAVKILGLNENYNNFYTTSPKTSHIKSVLIEHHLTTNEAWEIVTNRKESFARNTTFTKNVIEPILQYLRETKFELLKENNTSIDTKNEAWFKVGLEFAKGNVQPLYAKHKQTKGCFNIITRELGFDLKVRPYVSDTLNQNSKHNNKNIYYYVDKVKKIHQHCLDNNIKIHEDFLSQFDKLQFH